jgi:hypothetical protein
VATTAQATTVPDEQRKRPGLQALAFGIFAFCLAATATSLYLTLTAGDELPDSLIGIGAVSGICLELLFAAVGLLIVAHRPDNVIGWLLLVPSFVRNVEKLFVFYGARALIEEPGTLPLGDEAIWVNTWIWMPLLGVVPVILLVYPDGRFRSPRWHWAAWASVGGGAASGLLMAIAVWPHRSKDLFYPDTGLDELTAVIVAFVTLLVVFLVTTSAGLASLVLRYRKGTEQERLQIKWLAVAVVLLLVDALLIVAIETEADWREVVSNVAFASVPVAIGIAVFKYRLYRIDVIIDRTLVYVPLLALIAAVASALVPLSQKVFVALTGTESDASIVFTALFITVLISPARKALEALVEGRFKPKPPEPEATTDGSEVLSDPEFVASVRSIAEQAALDAVRRDRERE